MDRFKFRAWKQDNWGYNIKNEFVKQKPHYEYFELNNNIKFIKTDIIEQCTGLKDKNGKLIYEGDIVNTSNFGKCFIEWADDEAGFTLHSTETVNYYSIYCCNGFEIIGNIHQNPELLED